MRAKRTLKDKILPCYRHLFDENDINIEFIWGTRDSGKSKAGGQLLIYEYSKITEDFKGVLIRKVRDTIKDSVYSNVLSTLCEWKLEQYFTTTKSPLEIRSLINNGVILSRGLDEVGKIKSLSNPTHALIDEADQITSDDFTTILTTFRHNKIKPKFIVMFNPELPNGIQRKEDWWVYRDWFSHTDKKNFTHTKEIVYLDENNIEQKLFIKYRSTHTTFNDNSFCPPERKAHYLNLQFTNPTKFLPYAKGDWGVRFTNNPFFYSYSHDKHFRNDYKIEPTAYLDISFDFNKEPCTAVIGQYNHKEHIFAKFDVILGTPKTLINKSPLEAVCYLIKQKYIDSGLFTPIHIRVTGDPAGKQGGADLRDLHSFYTTIKNELGINSSQCYIRNGHTTHIFSGEVSNKVYRELSFNQFIITHPMIENDINLAFADEKESLNKAKAEHGLHVLDAVRYLDDFWFCYHKGHFTSDMRVIGNYISNIKTEYDRKNNI